MANKNRFVFLDTEVFIANNFNYKADLFKRIIELVENEEITLYSTTVTIQEIRNNIYQQLQKAKSTIKHSQEELRKKLKEGGKIIYNSIEAREKMFADFNYEQILEIFEKEFNLFLSETKTIVLSINDVSPEEIFSKYFQNQPPFKDGKKKHEFPDAFTLAVLEKLGKAEGQPVYVVSGDSDMKSACQKSEDLIWIERIDKLLELIITEEEERKEIILLCHDVLIKNIDEVNRLIAKQFISETEFSLSESYNYEYGSEYIDVTVDSVEFVDSSLVNFNGKSIGLILYVHIAFIANIAYRSLDLAIWNREGQLYPNTEEINARLHRQLMIPVEIKFNFFEDDISLIEIEEINVAPNQVVKTIEIEPNWDDDDYRIKSFNE